jgi:hypothetical protein
MDTLLALARQGRAAYTARWLGRSLEAIPENQERGPPGYEAALSENYLRLLIPRGRAPLPEPGRPFRCRLSPLPALPPAFAPAFDALGLAGGLPGNR